MKPFALAPDIYINLLQLLRWKLLRVDPDNLCYTSGDRRLDHVKIFRVWELEAGKANRRSEASFNALFDRSRIPLSRSKRR
jgi:hypothetical protein